MSEELPQPPVDSRGLTTGPHFYPKLLRRVADLQEALIAFEQTDPDNIESPHFVGHVSLAIYNEEMATDDDDTTSGLVGWVVQEDTKCWLFIPFVKPVDPATEVAP